MSFNSFRKVSQDCESPLQRGRDGPFVYWHAYSRSADSRASGDAGQDYLTFQANEETFVFALCDGVSQSFYGDLAARLLGDTLVTWLASDPAGGSTAESFALELADRLRALTVDGTGLVYDQALPETIPEMLRDVLEEKRAMGSESMFICGRIDLPGATLPEGRLALAWLGDSRIRLWGSGQERTDDLGETFHTHERWSTRQGLLGEAPHVFVRPVLQFGQADLTVMAYTDGLDVLDGSSPVLVHGLVEETVAAGQAPGPTDDAAFLEVRLAGR